MKKGEFLHEKEFLEEVGYTIRFSFTPISLRLF